MNRDLSSAHADSWGLSARDLCIGALLLLLIGLVYFPVAHYQLINYDDPIYVTRNLHVTSGLTVANIRWALTSTSEANWFPLTWISLMAVHQFFGPGPGAQHVVNVILHAGCTLLLFVFLRRTTGSALPSAAVAFLFALHPLHVESVAWVTERKDVLSTFFWMLALCSYAAYSTRRSASRYLLTLLFYALGLMSKPMVVTLPAVLVLLDYWPLGRCGAVGIRELLTWRCLRSLLLDKLPFLAISAALSAFTIMVQAEGGAVRSLSVYPLSVRLTNAVLSGSVYLLKMVWPSGLAVFYPMHTTPPEWQPIASAVFLAAVTVLVIRYCRPLPFLLTGWFWYLITVLPVIGIIQVGEQARADRYTYIPLVGAFMMIAWGAAEVIRLHPNLIRLSLPFAIAAAVACLMVTGKQIRYWKDSETLFRHALDVTAENEIAYACLGDSFRAHSRFEDALVQYRHALAVNPKYAGALMNYGATLGQLGRYEEAVPVLAKAVNLNHDNPEVHLVFGTALGMTGRLRPALEQFEIALVLQPDSAAAHIGLGITYGNLGRNNEALSHFQEALRLQPDSAEARAYVQKALTFRDRGGH